MKRLVILSSACVCVLLLASGSLAMSAAVPVGQVPGLQHPERIQPTVRQAVHSDVSPPLRTIRPNAPDFDPDRPTRPLISGEKPGGEGFTLDPVVQRAFGPFAMPTPIQNFDGAYNHWGAYPPDTTGEAGRNHYVQQVNIGFQIWTKTGAPVYGPASFNTLFTGFGGPCERRNDGDPVVLYDQLANRWLLSQFTTASPYLQCIAISSSDDPTGTYYRYAFPETTFEDYPHFGVWPDAYYMSANDSGSTHFAFERGRMLAGDPTARMVSFHVAGDYGLLPSDLDGNTLPPPGSPNFYLETWSGSPGQLRLWRFHVDWATPSNSTFTGPVPVAVANFDENVGGVEQPGTSVRLDDLSDRLMFRVAYRNMGTHESLLANHTVRDPGTGKAAVRWYELRSPGTTPTVFQQGTYAPDATHRWMASIAMDYEGNIAVGYSASSTSIYPSVRYAGRLVTDPPGTLPQSEETLIAGTGSQTGPEGRWGDYSMMAIDPVDDCTFWYTTEYIQVTGERTWRTRIGSFRFPSCVAPPTPTVTGTPPTASPTHTPTNTPTATPTLCAAGAVYTGSIGLSDPTQTGRVALRAPESTCALPKACASPLDAVPRHYRTHSYANSSGASQCVTISLVDGCSDNALWSVAYLNTFNPNGLCQNYLADGGRGGRFTHYSFNLPAGATAVVVVHEVNANVGCETYTLTINPCGAGGGPTSTPTNTVTPGAATSTATSTSTGQATLTWTPSGTPGTPAVTFTPTVTPTPCTITFTDVHQTDYFYEAVRYLYCAGVISGYSDNTFRPYNNTTRGQLTKIVVLAFGFEIYTPPNPTFTDVPTTDPFYRYVETAAYNLLVSGYADGTFRPYNNVTRGQLCKIVVIAAGWSLVNPPTPTFTDVDPESTFYTYIETAYDHGIISGYADGTFRPGNNATRGQISKIVHQAVTGP